MENQKKQVEKLLKKKKVTPSWCGKCLGDFDIRYIPVKEGSDLIIVYGVCDKCNVVTGLRILKKGEVFAVDYLGKDRRYKYKTSKTLNT